MSGQPSAFYLPRRGYRVIKDAHYGSFTHEGKKERHFDALVDTEKRQRDHRAKLNVSRGL